MCMHVCMTMYARLANTKQRLKSKAIYMYVRLKNKKLLEGLKGFLIMIIVLTKF